MDVSSPLSDREHNWHAHAYSSRKGSGLRTNEPRVTCGVFGVLGVTHAHV